MTRSLSLALFMLLSFAAALVAQDRKTKVLSDRDTFAKNEVWLYNDLDAAFAAAKKGNKPLLVVFRCIPCEACSHFDKQLLDEQESMRDLLYKFVCVRVVKANGLDLRLFQFDYDQSFHAMFLNADRTIYGRYGTRSQNKEDDDMTLAGFRKAMEAVLKLHAGYPKNKVGLEGKSGGKVPFEVPEAMPGLTGKYTSKIDYEGNVVQSCIHCHQIRDAERVYYRNQGKEIPEKVLYPYPLPSVIGLTMDPNECNVVRAVEKGSIAAQNWRPGDRIESLNGQPVVSTADIQWVLHNATDRLEVAHSQKDGSSDAFLIDLPKGWRTKSDLTWRPTTWDLRRMALGGMWLKDLSDEERAKRGLKSDGMALWIKHLGQFGEHAVAKNAGFQQDDVLVAVGGESGRWSETDLIAAALKKPKGEKLDVTVLRGKDRIDLKLPLQ